jgi:hypothetical protein
MTTQDYCFEIKNYSTNIVIKGLYFKLNRWIDWVKNDTKILVNIGSFIITITIELVDLTLLQLGYFLTKVNFPRFGQKF